jgi:hypothetical protein
MSLENKMIATRLSSTSISVEKTIPETTVTQEYDLKFLLSQREAITRQAEEFAEARQKELDEVEELIEQCEKLGVVDEVAQVVVDSPRSPLNE